MDQLKEGLTRVFDVLSFLYLIACETGLIITYTSNTMIMQAALVYFLVASKAGQLWVERRFSGTAKKRTLYWLAIYSLSLAIMVTVFQCGRLLKPLGEVHYSMRPDLSQKRALITFFSISVVVVLWTIATVHTL